MSHETILEVDDLSIEFPQDFDAQPKIVVDEISFSIKRGQMLGLVGESGSGKTMVALSIMGLVPGLGRASSGRILLDGRNLLQEPDEQLRSIRGGAVSIVFQDPLASFNPVRPVGSLLTRSIMLHQHLGEKAAQDRSAEMLSAVGIANPVQRMHSYPHEFSGGQRQRIMVALAAINNPRLIIADEPTTALDATVQIQIWDLLKSLTVNCSLLLITHDLSVTAGVCEQIVVMRKGKIVESGCADDVLTRPQEPYTRALVEAVPRYGGHRRLASKTSASEQRSALLEVRNLDVTFIQSGRSFKAVDDVSLTLNRNETLGIVGESGSGKSTIAKAMMQLLNPSGGQIMFDGEILEPANRHKTRDVRRRIQYVFQDPYASLDPRWTVGKTIAEPMHVHKIGTAFEIHERVIELLDQVELPADAIDRYPAEFSGGQRQRIALARSLGVGPDLLIADEPLSSLDVTIQFKIAQLLKSLQKQYSLSLVLIAHDLPLVYQMTDRVAVVYLGQVVEQGPTEKVLRSPQHPYTASLLSASIAESFEFVAASLRNAGEPASPLDPPNGCRFHPRCPIAKVECAATAPVLTRNDDGTEVSCHFPGKIDTS
jgi:oligopeptide/dipeptide ABC transporter ATP-binding protein